MPRDKDKEAKLVRQKTKQAVDLALAAKWREAIEVNKSILEIARMTLTPITVWVGLI